MTLILVPRNKSFLQTVFVVIAKLTSGATKRIQNVLMIKINARPLRF